MGYSFENDYGKLKSIVEILSDMQIELEANHMLGKDILEITVNKRFFDRLKMELLDRRHVVNMGGFDVVQGTPQSIEEFNNWDETEVWLPCGKVLIRSI